MKTYLLLLATLLSLSQCKKNDPTPEEQLPPATQTGANTFGCLVNGQAWKPSGNDGSSNYSVYYDRGYAGGTLNISTYRYSSSNSNSKQLITLYSDSLLSTGIYVLTKDGHQEALFKDRATGCEFFGGTYYRRGTLIITRLDLNAGIISGIFAFTLYKQGCDSIQVTQGRFDKKL